MIYFDNNATTPMAPEVMSVYLEASKLKGNASSVHRYGQEARRFVNEARETLAGLLHVSAATLVFTSGGTEAINAAMLGTFLPRNEKNHLIVSAVEHSSVLKCAEFLRNFGVEVTSIGVDSSGHIDLHELESSFRLNSAMVVMQFANNETGAIFPVKRIGEMARAHGALFLCDAVQAVGKLSLDLSLLPIDLLAASAHKFHGPKGVGMLYIRDGVKLSPLHHGGRQERGRRAGTENIPGILAMVEALKIAQDRMLHDERHLHRLRDRLGKGLLEKIPGIHFHGDPEHCLANTLNFRVDGISGESLLINLDLAGVAASSGSACDSGSIDPSHVLMAMGLSREQALGGLRFSLSRYNTEQEVDQVIDRLSQIVERIQSQSS